MRCLATKTTKIPQIFKYARFVLPWKQNCEFKSRNLICLRVGLCMQYCQSIFRLIFYVFYYNCVNLNIGGVNYRTSGMLKFDKFCNQTATVAIIWVQLVSIL